ncbi:protein-disulfide reductase DsbD [Bordetella genomosp. 9]|uniref:Thiol:disulfide interchange protein DsbD n=1 Tax=Bordetella genomosp. 9 TaxID=1416803 RepID=A0A261R8B2_9BORD|nr:protein-disulfide reductase DsbD [Bordetella genomosp. 9]OZI21017.1 protein-disulfide reductase DsbD [Bordetella genomosp. 9]
MPISQAEFAAAPLTAPGAPDPSGLRVLRAVLALAVLFVAWLALAMPVALAADDFLAPEQAFPFAAAMDGPDTLRIDYKVAKGYYMYRERFAFDVAPVGAATLGDPVFPAGEVKYDPTFDKNMEVYHQPLSIRVPLRPGGGAFTLNVTGQGCADKGVCYPPMVHTVSLQPVQGGYRITATGTAEPGAIAAGAGFSAAPSLGGALAGAVSAGQDGSTAGIAQPEAAQPGSAQTGGAQPGGAQPGGAQPGSAQPGGGLTALTRSDDVGLAGAIAGLGLLKTAGVFFLLGVLLSLTPCVLPMIPILSSVVVGAGGQHRPGRGRGLALAAAYVLGMSLVYTALGVAAGLSGIGLAAWLQTPWILGLFAALLALLALAMFDVFTLQVPGGMQTGLNNLLSRVPGGRGTGAFVMGAVSALIVGPCVAAPLAGALLYISQTGDVGLGAAALFAMAWGMGVPLLVVGGSAGSLLPRAGAWMEGVKRFFGMLLLGTAWWMLIPLLPVWLQMVGWALLGLIGAVMLRAFEPLPAAGGTGRMFAKGAGLMLALLAVVMLVGAASGGRDVLHPLAHLAAGGPVAGPRLAAGGTLGGSLGGTPGGASGSTLAGPPGAAAAAGQGGAAGARPGALAGESLHFVPVRSLAELDAAVAGAGRPVMLDFYADWCVSCREMEQFTFSDPAVATRMGGMLLLRADVTANNADDRALLKRFKLFGPPGIMFFDAGGRELADIRVIGFQDAARFTESLDRVAAR